jgi:general stress protein 26
MKLWEFEQRTIDVHAEPGSAARQAMQRVSEFLRAIHVAMLTTTDPRGHLRSRPMALHTSELEDELWFYLDARAGIIDDITGQHQVGVIAADPGKNRWLAVGGIAHVVRDETLLRKFWDRRAAEWFPDGPDRDPHLALLRVQIEEAELWDGGSKTVLRLTGLARTDERPIELPRVSTLPAEARPSGD